VILRARFHLLATNRSRTGLQLWCKPRQVTAKTVRNGGSSRAARAVAAAFDGRGRLVGCRFDTLPLDRDRILSPPAADRCCSCPHIPASGLRWFGSAARNRTACSGPRNYHAFYQLCFGASQAERERLRLGSVRDYRLLNRASCFQAGTRDEDGYTGTLETMRALGLSAGERRAATSALAAVLHAGPPMQPVQCRSPCTGVSKPGICHGSDPFRIRCAID
jgi:myosin-5